MTYLVARIDYALTRGINWLTTCLVERARGFSSSEAGDFLAAPGPSIHGYRLSPEAQARWGEPSRCPNAGSMCNCTGECMRPQTPAASAGRGESSSPGVSATPRVPSGERTTTDPSPPTIASRQHQPSVDGEGSPEEIATFARRPAGERPTWVDWAVPAICDVLAEHEPSDEYVHGTVTCFHADDSKCRTFTGWLDWREHVAPLIAERLYLASKPPLLADWPETGLDMGARIDGASEIFPQHRTTQK